MKNIIALATVATLAFTNVASALSLTTPVEDNLVELEYTCKFDGIDNVYYMWYRDSDKMNEPRGSLEERSVTGNLLYMFTEDFGWNDNTDQLRYEVNNDFLEFTAVPNETEMLVTMIVNIKDTNTFVQSVAVVHQEGVEEQFEGYCLRGDVTTKF